MLAYLINSQFILGVQYSRPKFTLFSEHFGHAYDVISLNSINDVTKKTALFFFKTRHCFCCFLSETSTVLRKYYYTSVLEHILAKKHYIFLYFIDAKYGHTFWSAILHYTQKIEHTQLLRKGGNKNYIAYKLNNVNTNKSVEWGRSREKAIPVKSYHLGFLMFHFSDRYNNSWVCKIHCTYWGIISLHIA